MQQPNVFADLPTLETERLVLRKITEADVDDVFEYASDPLVAENTSWSAHRSREESAAQVARWLERYRNGQVGPWGVEHREDHKLVGTCGYVMWEGHRAEVGYALSRRYWTRGYMTEALREVVRFGFEQMGLNRIQATCLVRNVASYRVMEKAGMAFEGVLREYAFAKGRFEDLKMYSVIRKEWTG
jgi:ribosomal-protein-alanine N-acetyltransferase